MSKRIWLILDVPNLAWRSFHTLGGLSYKGNYTGVVFGLMRDFQVLMDEHATRNIAFCFDSPKSKRKEIYPDYKISRKNKFLTEPEKEAYAAVRQQMNDVMNQHLPDLGYENIFMQEGYEADDMIAACVQNMRKKDKALIVTCDQDLYQCISPRVSIWNPITKKCLTEEMFCFNYKCKPTDWAKVKALMGCKSDDIIGCTGIGEKYATRYIARKYPKGLKVTARMRKFMESERYALNLRLTTLPFEGGVPVTLRDQSNISSRKWNILCDKLGMKSLRRIPTKKSFGFS